MDSFALILDNSNVVAEACSWEGQTARKQNIADNFLPLGTKTAALWQS
jgi:hypothetical protein